MMTITTTVEKERRRNKVKFNLKLISHDNVKIKILQEYLYLHFPQPHIEFCAFRGVNVGFTQWEKISKIILNWEGTALNRFNRVSSTGDPNRTYKDPVNPQNSSNTDEGARSKQEQR